MIRRLLISLFLLLLAILALTAPSDARPRHHHTAAARQEAQYSFFGIPIAGATAPIQPHRQAPAGLRRVMADGAGRVVGGRPPGCPRRFCGCGASLYLFGKIVPTLNRAANWLRFPRINPAPGMAAARRGHVFVLRRHINGPVWEVFDANSGHHRIRIHQRSIAGFSIVDPRAGA